MSILYDDCMNGKCSAYDENQEDCDFFKCLYPPEIMEMQMRIENKCNELEYVGSVMYDKYPDRIRLEKMSKDMCKENEKYDEKLMQVMLINEMLKRRLRRRV